MPRERPPRKRATPPPTTGPMRLHAFLARAGVASRRASEDLIRAGKVTVNGRTAQVGESVDPAVDAVRYAGRPVGLRPTEWIALHKPRGYVTTRDDPENRKTIYDLLPAELHHLFHVGRLDRDSSGLLLLTNDGDAANRLLHPRYGTTKEYRADIEGEPAGSALRELISGVVLEDGLAKAVSVQGKGMIGPGLYRVVIVLEEGRNREVRRMFEAVGHPVQRLYRRGFGPISIGRLAPGRWRHLTEAEIATLRGEDAGDPRRSRPGRGRTRARRERE